ncbi:MAG: hypothetical protein OFPI_17030 [Osedax symbiont Rs2]|nr:MAG: hypothetical protein OFPI_17030 [Osedax symbiont Rs2]
MWLAKSNSMKKLSSYHYTRQQLIEPLIMRNQQSAIAVSW